jgi:hypothetical protein
MPPKSSPAYSSSLPFIGYWAEAARLQKRVRDEGRGLPNGLGCHVIDLDNPRSGGSLAKRNGYCSTRARKFRPKTIRSERDRFHERGIRNLKGRPSHEQ